MARRGSVGLARGVGPRRLRSHHTGRNLAVSPSEVRPLNLMLVVARILHVVLGATWVGFATFAAFFVVPAIQDVGPDGGKVMAALQRRGLLIVLPVIAIVTILSGIWLYWRASVGFQAEYSRSTVGMTYGVGGFLALVAYVIGLAVVRPAMARSAALSQTLSAATSEAERSQRLAEIGRIRAKGALGGKWVAILLIVATGAMAIARYV